MPAATPKRRSGGFDFLILIALVVFVASATLAIGVFLYVQYLNTSASSKVGQLDRAKAAFEPALIDQLTRLDDRMRASDTILSAHIAPTALFHLLEQLTLQTVSFTKFDFKEIDAGNMTLNMQGIAQSVNSIALQADLLSKTGVITNPIFSNINRQIDGVHFDFSANINPDALRYRSSLTPSAAQQQAQVPAPAQAPAVSPFGAQSTPASQNPPATTTPSL